MEEQAAKLTPKQTYAEMKKAILEQPVATREASFLACEVTHDGRTTGRTYLLPNSPAGRGPLGELRGLPSVCLVKDGAVIGAWELGPDGVRLVLWTLNVAQCASIKIPRGRVGSRKKALDMLGREMGYAVANQHRTIYAPNGPQPPMAAPQSPEVPEVATHIGG